MRPAAKPRQEYQTKPVRNETSLPCEEFLSEVKSEIFVVEGFRGKFDKSDLTFDEETNTRVVDLLTREARFRQ